jgi:hypothetical protein
MKQAILVVVAVIAAVGGAIFGISRVADVSDLDAPDRAATEKERTEEWETDAIAAFGGPDLTSGVVEMMEGAREWLAGERPTEQFRIELDRLRNRFLDVATRLDDLRPFPYDERVNGLYRDAADLYLQVVQLYQGMLAMPPADERTQVDLLARRIRILGDRVFDRGHELVKPTLHESANPDVDIRLPEEVPNWVEEGIVAGPPLEPPPPPPSGEPTLRQATRPQQPRPEWLKAVKAIGAPTEAKALIDAAERLRGVPDPRGDREEGARIRLSLLLDADAAYAARLQLADVSRALARVADHLWQADGLPPR